MDALEEYQKIILLVSSFVAKGEQRPVHVINHTKAQIGIFAQMFEKLDDDFMSIAPIARTVGAHISDDDDVPGVIVI